jgi:hypothetical protein
MPLHHEIPFRLYFNTPISNIGEANECIEQSCKVTAEASVPLSKNTLI